MDTSTTIVNGVTCSCNFCTSQSIKHTSPQYWYMHCLYTSTFTTVKQADACIQDHTGLICAEFIAAAYFIPGVITMGSVKFTAVTQSASCRPHPHYPANMNCLNVCTLYIHPLDKVSNSGVSPPSRPRRMSIGFSDKHAH
jgi:hypothetical protein